MLLTNAPGKITLPFASSGAKNTIPVASQIGITPGAASLVDGFPPLTRTPIAAGGVPPSGLDFNGILYELSAVIRWANAGGGYTYDATFAADTNVNGYPKGARVMRSDGLGYWFNTVDNNTVDPESAGAVAAGWVPDFTTGASVVPMASANVTLTPLQYGKPVIIITGVLTANLNLIFPTMVGEWTVINNTTGAFAVTCKTAAGTGVTVNSAMLLVGDGTNIVNGNLDSMALLGANVGTAGGTADALTVTLAATVRAWTQIAGVPFWLRAPGANTLAAPTVAVNGLAAKTSVKGAGVQLQAGDYAGAGHWLQMQYDATLDKVVLANPAFGVSGAPAVVGAVRNGRMAVTAASAVATYTADEIVVSTGIGGACYKLPSFSKTINLATTGAGAMDTGTSPASGFVAVYAIYNPLTGASNLLATNATPAAVGEVYGGANMPAGYTASALVAVWPTNGSAQFVIGLLRDRKFIRASVNVMSGGTATSYTSIALTNAVPKNATAVSGWAHCITSTSGGGPMSIAGDGSGSGTQQIGGGGNASGVAFYGAFSLPILTVQTLYYSTSNMSSSDLSITGYEF